jgi:drug/metabolite transporter (DMT)-like permease
MERMDRRRIGIVLAAAGVVVLVLSAFADPFGYGDEGFGWLQTLGVILGVAAIAVGVIAAFWRRPMSPPQPSR